LFKVKLTDAKLWRNLMTAISTLIDEATFNANEEGIALRAMDPSHVAMVDFAWPKTAFEEYRCDQPMKICVNISEMLKLLRGAGSDEVLELSLDEQTGRLNLRLQGKYVRTFSMATLESTGEETPTPKISFNAKARITTDCLKQAVDDAATVSDHVRLEALPEKLILRATGDLGSVTIELEKNSEALLSLEVKEESKATFSLNYLAEIIKAASIASPIATVEFSSNMPIKIDFELAQQGKLSYLLAPRIETE
jgi:proliferating cell nuclear antigen